MKIKSVEVSYGTTISTGVKFEFIRVDMKAAADLEDTEDPQVARRQLLVQLKNDVDEANKRILSSMD